MNSESTSSPDPGESAFPEEAERLALAQAAFAKYYTRCFWFMNKSLVVTPALVPKIIAGLRSNGDRKAFIIADKLCR
jgi:hypothetical protein